MMVDVKIILSALWVALMFLYQQGDVQRLYSGDFIAGEIEGMQISQEMLWLVSAITMTIPVVMIILSLTLPHNANRWANIIVAILFFVYSLGVNVLTVWYAWKWI
jgi:hypothetical protein